MIRALPLVLLGLVSAGRPLAGQAAEMAAARADSLQRNGHWSDARALLLETANRCPADSSGRSCRLVSSRALGYLAQRQAQVDPSQARDLLEQSTAWYGEALKVDSSDSPSLTNLVFALRSLGKETELTKVLDDAMTSDPGNGGFYARQLGDVFRARGDLPEALTAYRRAVIAAPENETARRRVIETYALLPDSIAGLFDLVSSGDWEQRFPDATARAYEIVVPALATRDRPRATRACTRWVIVLANAQLLSPARLGVLGETWLAEPLRQLAAFIADPKQPAPLGPVWNSRDGMEAVGRAALAAGRQRVATGDIQGAAAFWLAGLRTTHYSASATVDLALDLADLYVEHKELDPKDSVFREMEDRVFSEKGVAYQIGDIDKLQMFHTLLGQLYTRRRQFATGDFRNAIFQLEHALEMAARRDRAGDFYQPLPQLRAMLADAYRETGRPTTRAYLDAAKAYLDVDGLDDAQRMLERSGPIVVSDNSASRALSVMIRERSAAGTAATRPSQTECRQKAESGVAAGRQAGFDSLFLKRQRFKLLADCSLAGAAPVRPEDAAAVLQTAVDDKVPLIGAGDLVRLQRSQAAVQRLVRTPYDPKGTRAIPKDRTTPLKLLMPAQVQPTTIPISSDLLAGARVAAQSAPDPNLAALEVRDGKVTALVREGGVLTRAPVDARAGERAAAPPPAAIAGRARPRPAATAPAAPADVRDAVARYAAALETRSLDRVQAVVPQLGDPKALYALFERAVDLKAELNVQSFDVNGENGTAVIGGTLRYIQSGLAKQEAVDQRATFVRDGSRWRLVAIR